MNTMAKRILGGLAGLAVAAAAVVVPASAATAAETAVVDLADTQAVQGVVTDVSIVDDGGRTFAFTVTTSWSRISDTQAELRSIVVRPAGFPAGECVLLTVGSTAEIGYSASARTLCDTGYLTYAPNTVATATSGTNLGQLTLSAPDPANPFGGGAVWMYIEYHS